jgi:Flp pilus assembly protein TadD
MRSPVFRNLLLATILLSCLQCFAQRGPEVRTSIRGSVRDAVTHRALERVVVMVDAEDSGYAGQSETDSSGRFEIQGLSPSSYRVSVRFPGYVPMTQHIDLTTSPMTYLSFELRPLASREPPAVAPEGPDAVLNARLASVPEKARKEFTKARELWQQGKDPQDGIDHLNKAIKSYPRFADAYVMQATLYMQEGKANEAKSALDHAIDIDPKLPEARFTLGSLQNSQKDYMSAEKTLSEGLKLDEQSPHGHYELAKTYWAMGRWQDAEPHALRAATLQPGMAPVHVLLGNIALRKRDPQAALKEFQEYLRLDPKGPMAEGTQAMVKKLEDGLNHPQ